MDQITRAQQLERIYERRAARTRRSKWLGGVLFSMIGIGLTLSLRMNPSLAEDIVALSYGMGEQSDVAVVEKPTDIHVRAMPSDVVPVRRGSGFSGSGSPFP